MKLVNLGFTATISVGEYEALKMHLSYEMDEGDTIEEAREVAMDAFKLQAKLAKAEGSKFLKM